jgi:hypothetical protein
MQGVVSSLILLVVKFFAASIFSLASSRCQCTASFHAAVAVLFSVIAVCLWQNLL